MDWSGCDLDDAIMVNADLAGANLSGASLTGHRRQENLSGANLTGAKLSHALMDGANLTGAKLTNANLTGANLSAVVLAGVRIGGANLTGADLTNANLNFATLHGTDLKGATLTGATLTGAAWLNATCPDGSNSNKHTAGCTSPLDTTPPVAAPAVTSGTPGANGWYVTPVVVSWNWTDDGAIVDSTCQQLSSTAALGKTTFRAACTDLAGNVGHARFPVKVDYSFPVGSVRGVTSRGRYVIGKVPTPGCTTREPYSGVAVRATLRSRRPAPMGSVSSPRRAPVR